LIVTVTNADCFFDEYTWTPILIKVPYVLIPSCSLMAFVMVNYGPVVSHGRLLGHCQKYENWAVLLGKSMS
jgi:hypothetical protein